jgi:outer membrane protein assembly factor BamE (lipoprotein component of BamABCDE complex)
MMRCLWFISVLAVLFNGCIIIPTPEHDLGMPMRGQIPPKTINLVKPGITTREQVLLNLGEPDIVADNDAAFVYLWCPVEGYFIIGVGAAGGGVGGGGGMAPLPRMYCVIIKFDDQGIVRSCDAKHTDFFAFLDSNEKYYKWLEIIKPLDSNGL